MNIHQEQQWKERDFERFRLSEYNATKRQHEPVPEGAVLKKCEGSCWTEEVPIKEDRQ